MLNALYYNQPVDWIAKTYENPTTPFKAGAVTGLPKNIAVIRAIFIAAVAGICVFSLSSSVFVWPVALIGVALVCSALHSHFRPKDPLIQAFRQIAGGKGAFGSLPIIDINQDPKESLSAAVRKINWENLESPISRAKTLDGRRVVIVKGISFREEKGISFEEEVSTVLTVKTVFAFVEKLAPSDLPRQTKKTDLVMHATRLPFKGNTFGEVIGSVKNYSLDQEEATIDEWQVCSSISKKMANEWYVQMNGVLKPLVPEYCDDPEGFQLVEFFNYDGNFGNRFLRKLYF